MVFGVLINRLLLESPLADAPQINGYTLLITELGTEIIALMLHYRFYCVTIVAHSAIVCYASDFQNALRGTSETM